MPLWNDEMIDAMRRSAVDFPTVNDGEGQGESSGPSFYSWLRDEIRDGEIRPYEMSEAQQELVARMSEQVREQQRQLERSIWRDGRGPLTATEAPTDFYIDDDGVMRPYWGSQVREEPPRWVGNAEGSARPITFADLQNTWIWASAPSVNDPIHLRRPNLAATEQRSERGEQMRFSGRPDPLNERDQERLTEFYRKVLRDGFAQWPLDNWRVPLFVDGTMRRIYYDSRWNCETDHIYIGASRDEGTGAFASPAARLACVATLMGITGHSNRPDLIALLAERLAKVMAGVYDSVVKPLAATVDARPIRRMAWSASGGLASWCDGGWVGLTGEPVEVGEGWTVIDTEEGPVEGGLPPTTTPGATVATRPGVGRSFEDMRRENSWITRTAADGRSFVHWMVRETAQENFGRVQAEGYPVEWIEDGGFYGIAPLRVAEIVMRTPREEFEEAARTWGTDRMPDGRLRINLTYPTARECEEELRNHSSFRRLTQLSIEEIEGGRWVLTYPLETVSAAPTMTHAQWEEVKERFDRWYPTYNTQLLENGQIAVGFGSRETTERYLAIPDLAGCIVVPSYASPGNWAITYPPEPPPDVVRGYDELMVDRSWSEGERNGITFIPLWPGVMEEFDLSGYTGIRWDENLLGIVRA